MKTTENRDQDEFIHRMGFDTRRSALDRYPKDLAHRDTLDDRLDTFVFGLWNQLEGNGGLDPHRLSPKGRPDVDIVIPGMHSAWNNPDHFKPEGDADRAAAELFTAVRAKLGEHQAKATAEKPEPLAAMTALVTDILQIIEAGYELVRQEDVPGGDGPDIAPGLTAAYQAAMAQANV